MSARCAGLAFLGLGHTYHGPTRRRSLFLLELGHTCPACPRASIAWPARVGELGHFSSQCRCKIRFLLGWLVTPGLDRIQTFRGALMLNAVLRKPHSDALRSCRPARGSSRSTATFC